MSQQCLNHRECPAGSCGPTNTCRYTLRPHDFCTDSKYCPSGYTCQRGRCGKAQANSPCQYHSDCGLSQYCGASSCITRGTAGSTCSESQHCQDGFLCRQGICKPRCLNGAGYCNANEMCVGRNNCKPAVTFEALNQGRRPHGEPDRKKWYIIGGSVGGVILILLIGLAVFFYVKRRRQNRPVYQPKMSPSSPAEEQPPAYTPPSAPFQAVK